jgi:hypothetical protein
LTFTFVVDPLIKTLSRYGASGIKQMLGDVIVSGMPLYTLAAIVESAVFNGVRMSDSILIGTSPQHPKMAQASQRLCLSSCGQAQMVMAEMCLT